MNPDQPRTPREELELRITSLLLGELPAAEAAAVREAIAKDPELAKLHDDLMQTIQLVRAVTAIEPAVTASETPALKLSDERRKKLVTAFAIPPLKPEHRPVASARRHRFTLIELLVVVGFVAILAAMLLPALSKAKSKASSVAVRNNLRQIDIAKQMWAVDNEKAAGSAPTMEELKPYLGNRAEIPPVMGETYSAGQVGEPAFAEMDAKAAKGRLGGLPASSEPPDRVRFSSEGKLSVAGSSDEILRRFGKAAPTDGLVTVFATDASSSSSAKVAEPPLTTLTVTPPPRSSTAIVLPRTEVNGVLAGGVVSRDDTIVDHDADYLAFRVPVADGRETPPAARGFYDEGRGSVRSDPYGNTPPIAAAAEPPAMFYRFSGGGRGGGGGQSVPATPAPGLATGMQVGDKVAALHDLPTLGKAFQSDSSGDSFGVTVRSEGQVTPSKPAQPNGRSDFFSAGNLGTVRGRSEVEFEAAAPRGGVASDSWFGAQPQKQGNLALNESGKHFSEAQLFNVPKEALTDLSIDTRNLSVVDAAAATRAESVGREIPARRARGASSVGGALTEESLRRQAGETTSLGANVHSQDVAGYVDVNSTAAAGDQSGAKKVDALERYRELTGKQILRPDNLPAQNLWVDISKPLSKENEVAVLESSLALNGVAMVHVDDKFVKAVPQSQAAQEGAPLEAQVIQERSGLSGLWDGELSQGGGRRGGLTITESRNLSEELREESSKGKILKSDKAWEPEIQTNRFLARSYARTNVVFTAKGREGISNKLDRIRLNEVTYDGVPLGEVLLRLSAEVKNRDPEKRGVNFIFNPNISNRAPIINPTTGLTLASDGMVDVNSVSVNVGPPLTDIRLADVLDAIGKVSSPPLKYSVEDYGVVFSIDESKDGAPPKPKASAPIPQPEFLTRENAYSTFSLNVSDVSFKLAMASLEQGQMPDVASVRSEEFINAFNYHDPEPPAGSPIAFAWERARYPFAHNRDLLRFSIKTAAAGRQAGRPLNIVLLLDNSGSMERADRVQIIREALRVLAGQLQAQDKLSVITFARTARLVTDGISGDKAGEVAEQVSGLTPQGGTNLEEAMNLAYQTAARHYLANGINRVVLLTDGAANLGDVEPDSLKQKVETQRKQGIALDCFGIGWDGFNDDLLEVLSRNGDGRYGFLNSPEEAATDFVGQLAGALKVAASDVKVQVEFNPQRATAYRQIGYAKHQLTKEQFRDNTVDAAEIAAQEAGNALYTVEVNPRGEGPICIVRARYKVPGTTTYRELEWLVPFSGNASALEQASPAMRLAAGASAFSEWLVASPFAGEVTPDRLLGLLRGVPEAFGADSRPKKLEWMVRQAKSLEGK